MGGLLVYLVGRGRANEHIEPHLVAGDAAMMAWHDDAELGRDAALAIARHLDRPRTAFGVDMPGGHVWHCSLSLRAEEGLRTDQEWAGISQDFVTLMGFDDEQSPREPCRWVAVRHGVSNNGNDHVHLVVNLVRDDGTRASIHHDHGRAQRAARALEVKYGLERLESKDRRATRGHHPAEREAQARARARATYEHAQAGGPGSSGAWEQLSGAERQARIVAAMRVDQPRAALARRVRGSAAASETEAEYVRRLRRAGLLVRPRYAAGRDDVVAGYSVAERPAGRERPIWYGGGHLGRDLSLPRLREAWPDTPNGASEAVAEWTAAKRGRRVVAPGREVSEPDPELWQRYAAEVAQLRDRLRAVPQDDVDTWAAVARQTAGAFAAWSTAVEAEPGDLAAAADALATSAQTYRRPAPPSGPRRDGATMAVSGAAMLLASATGGGRGAVGQAVMLRQLVRLAQAVHDVAAAVGEARQAAAIAAVERNHLRAVAARLPKPRAAEPSAATGAGRTAAKDAAGRAPLDPETAAMLRRVQAGQQPATEVTSPLPRTLNPERPRPATRPGPATVPERGTGRGVER
ncbi:MAG: relaxase/mobilization nuclease domain-containing protein [Angustibacter sp.]